MKPIIEREGDDLVFSWPEPGVRIRVERIRESHEDLKATVTIQSTALDEEGHLWWGGLNLKAARSRNDVAGVCFGRLPVEKFWGDAIEQIAYHTNRLYAQGDPVVDIADAPFSITTPYLMDTLLPEGENTVLFGDGSAGKSLFARAICLSIISDVPMTRLLVPRKRVKILYLDWETVIATHARWFAKLSAGFGLERTPSILYKRLIRPFVAEAAELRALVARQSVGFVIVDSLAFACDGDPNDASVATQTMNGIRSLGCTGLILAHIPKASAEQGEKVNASIFGSRMFQNAARSTWEIKAVPNTPSGQHLVTLIQHKANEDEKYVTPIGVRFTFEPDGGPISVSEPYGQILDTRHNQKVGPRILDALPTGRSFLPSEVARQTGIAVDTVKARFREWKGVHVEPLGESTGGRGNEQQWIRKPDKPDGETRPVAFSTETRQPDNPTIKRLDTVGFPVGFSKNGEMPLTTGSLPGDRDQRDATGATKISLSGAAAPGDEDPELTDVPF